MMDIDAFPRCGLCGEREEIEILEIWNGHDFTIYTCCEALQEEVLWTLAHDPEGAKTILRCAGVEQIMGTRLRRVAPDDCCGLVLDWQFDLGDIDFPDAREFVRQHHSHCRPPIGWRYGKGLWNGSTLMAVVIVGRPSARGLDHKTIVEVTRLCVRRDVPSALRWNACSMLYSFAAKEAKRRGFQRIVTYTRQDEPGTTLAAAGWTQEAEVKGRSWSCPSREREDHAEPVDRIRWGRILQPPAKPPRIVPDKLQPERMWWDVGSLPA